MPKTITRSTGPDGGVIDADTDPDGVSAALGLDDAESDDDEQDPDEVDETDEGDDEDEDDEPTLAELAAAIAELKRDNAKLKREAAAARVKAKATPSKVAPATDSTDGETVEQAAERGREEARLELGLERAGDRIRAALTGIIPENDLDEFVDDLRLERYVDEDGKPDTDAIKALKDRQVKITRRTKPGGRSVGHARQGGGSTAKSKNDVMGDVLTSLGL